MRLKLAACEGDTLYAVKSTGELLWIHYDSAGGGLRWTQIDSGGWDEFIHLIAGDDGILYAVRPNGDLLWYQDTRRDGSNGADGSRGWHPRSGSKIGAGWNQFVHILPGGNGKLYAIKPNGDLLWYQDRLRNGTNAPDGSTGWALRSGNKIATDWNRFRHVFGGRNGTIYAIWPDGGLRFFKDMFGDGSNNWRTWTGWNPHPGVEISRGWDQFTHAVSGGSGIIYGFQVTNQTYLVRYQYEHDDGSPDDGATARTVPLPFGSNDTPGPEWKWQLAPIEGYCWPLSGSPGETIEFKVSSVLELDYDVAYLRLQANISSDGIIADGSLRETPMDSVFSCPGVHQPCSDFAWRQGCGWDTSFSLAVPPDWPSGFYAAKCTSKTGFSFYIPFVVKPRPARRSRVLVIANTNTWNAYNQWGGESNYSIPRSKRLHYARPNPLLLSVRRDYPTRTVGGPGRYHLLRGEIWVLEWLNRTCRGVDCCTDVDFHAGIPAPEDYKAVVLQTHPEYWSVPMYNRLKRYLSAGGTLLYLGGNAIYRTVTFYPDLQSFKTSSQSSRELFRNQGRGERSVLGMAYIGDDDSDFISRMRDPALRDDPTPSHPLLQGTGLTAGAHFGGTDGLNGMPSSWEVDAVNRTSRLRGDKSPYNIQVLAAGAGTVVDDNRGNMAYYSTGAGTGFVFAAGSISFGGSLVKNRELQQIVRNALRKCLGSIVT